MQAGRGWETPSAIPSNTPGYAETPAGTREGAGRRFTRSPAGLRNIISSLLRPRSRPAGLGGRARGHNFLEETHGASQAGGGPDSDFLPPALGGWAVGGYCVGSALRCPRARPDILKCEHNGTKFVSKGGDGLALGLPAPSFTCLGPAPIALSMTPLGRGARQGPRTRSGAFATTSKPARRPSCGAPCLAVGSAGARCEHRPKRADGHIQAQKRARARSARIGPRVSRATGSPRWKGALPEHDDL